MESFKDLHLSRPILKALEKEGIHQPTPIQQLAIPEVFNGKDVMATAHTGTGKTAAFVLPLLEMLSEVHYNKNVPLRALILTPTRELAIQISKEIKKFSAQMKPKISLNEIFGGVKIEAQVFKLKRGSDILVATPGRLIEFLKSEDIKLNKLQYLVMDEADKMLDMGFIREIAQIKKELPERLQYLFFSATYNKELKEFVSTYCDNPVEISASIANTVSTTIRQIAHAVYETQKIKALQTLLQHKKWKQVMVFVNTKDRAKQLNAELKKLDVHSEAIHGDLQQKERQQILEDFKTGAVNVLVSTDVAARGVDIDNLPGVINFEIPVNAEDYIHRIGRTGRAGNKGLAISIVDEDAFEYLRAVEKLTDQKIKFQPLSGFKPPKEEVYTGDIVPETKVLKKYLENWDSLETKPVKKNKPVSQKKAVKKTTASSPVQKKTTKKKGSLDKSKKKRFSGNKPGSKRNPGK